MTRQYVGARYVPKFYDFNGSANWRSGIEYEALTIVTRNGNSYTSKKHVPSDVGAPEDNPEYWAATGLYNNQVEAYRQLTLAVSDRLNDFMADGAIETDNIADNAITLNKLANDVDRINLFKKFIFIGDSFMAEPGSFLPSLINYLGLDSNDYYTASNGGASFHNANNSFINLIKSLYYSISDKDSIKSIVVIGSPNETGVDEGEVLPYIQTFVNYCSTNYPNAKVYIGCAIGGSDASMINTQNARAVRSYMQCYKVGAIYLSGTENLLRNKALTSGDHVHPASDDVYDYIGRGVGDAIINGYVSTGNRITRTFTARENYVNDGKPNIHEYQYDNVATITSERPFGIFNNDSDTQVGLTFTTPFVVGSLSEGIILGDSNVGWVTPIVTVSAIVRSAINNTAYNLAGSVYISNNNLVFLPYDYTMGGTSAFSKISELHIPPFSITIPTITA